MRPQAVLRFVRTLVRSALKLENKGKRSNGRCACQFEPNTLKSLRKLSGFPAHHLISQLEGDEKGNKEKRCLSLPVSCIHRTTWEQYTTLLMLKKYSISYVVVHDCSTGIRLHHRTLECGFCNSSIQFQHPFSLPVLTLVRRVYFATPIGTANINAE